MEELSELGVNEDQLNELKEIINEDKPKAPKVELTAEQRIEILQELSVLQQLINTTYYLPKYDKGNKGRETPKITGSIQLNYFSGELMKTWGERIAELSKML